MAKVKDAFIKDFLMDGDKWPIIIQWDVADDSEGYGVVIGDELSDETIAFGEGELAAALSKGLFDAVVAELNSLKEDELDKVSCFELLNTLYSFEGESVMMREQDWEELQSIITYINRWRRPVEIS